MRTKSTKVLVFNGWAARNEIWSLTTFPRDQIFNYLEELDGLPERVIADLDEVVLVGFSMGSQIALKMFLKFWTKVRALVLISATPRMMRDANWHGFSPRRLEALRLGTRKVYLGDPSPLYDINNLDRGIEHLLATDLRNELETLVAEHHEARKIPVEIIHSERDGIVSPYNVEYFRSLFPQATVTMVPGSEHVLPLIAPAEIDAALARVLRPERHDGVDFQKTPKYGII